MKKNDLKNNTGAVVLYKKAGLPSLEVSIKEETVWLTQMQVGQLFDVNVPAVSKHINNIISAGELGRISTVSKMEIVQKEGGRNIKWPWLCSLLKASQKRRR